MGTCSHPDRGHSVHGARLARGPGAGEAEAPAGLLRGLGERIRLLERLIRPL